MRYKCECCGNYTMPEKSSGTDYICPVCYWQDDFVQLHDHDFVGGANDVSLNQARENYKSVGGCESRVLQYVRNPFSEELPENNRESDYTIDE